MNYPIKKEVVHISDIKSGDCVLLYGNHRTISKKDIQQDSFWGDRIQGLVCSELGKYPVRHFERLLFPRFYQDSFIGYLPQN